MSNIFDRTYEREKIDVFFKNNSNYSRIVWIDGNSGTGKSFFVEYLISKYQENIYWEYSDNSNFYKCNHQDKNEEFKFIYNLLVTIEHDKSVFYEDKIFSYFDKIKNPTLLSSISLIFPQIKWFKWVDKLFKKNQDLKHTVDNKIIDKTLNLHLQKCFINLITDYIKKYTSNITFCIDDIIWMDKISFKIFLSVLKKLQMENYNFLLVVTARIHDKIEDSTDNLDIYNQLKSLSTHFLELQITNFDSIITKEFIEQNGNIYLKKNQEWLYKITDGNPKELKLAVKMPQNIIEKQINKAKIYKENYFSENLITPHLVNNTKLILLSLFSIINNKIEKPLLNYLTRKISNLYLKENIGNTQIQKEISELLKDEILKIDEYFIKIYHDSYSEIVLDYIISFSIYNDLLDIICDILITDSYIEKYFTNNTRYVHAINLQSTINPYKGFTLYKDYLEKEEKIYNKSLIEAGTICFIRDSINFNSTDLNKYSIILIDYLIIYSSFKKAVELGNIIFHNINLLNHKNLFIFISSYLKALTELCLYDDALRVISSFNNKNFTPDELFGIKLLEMAVKEHLLLNEDLVKIYKDLTFEIRNINSFKTKSLFYRNKGLIEFHGNLIYTYKKALVYAKKSTDKLLIATTLNNLGLSFLFNQEIEKAKKCFFSSINLLKEVNHEPFRPLNNLSIALLLNKEFELSYQSLIDAFDMLNKGKFEELSIIINLSLASWKLGLKNDAKELLIPILSKKESLSDTAIISRAYMLMGYYFYEEKQYIKASQYYTFSSKMHNFRYLGEEEKNRKEIMSSYCKSLSENIVCDIELDIEDRDRNFITKIYNMQPLAYYII